MDYLTLGGAEHYKGAQSYFISPTNHKKINCGNFLWNPSEVFILRFENFSSMFFAYKFKCYNNHMVGGLNIDCPPKFTNDKIIFELEM